MRYMEMSVYGIYGNVSLWDIWKYQFMGYMEMSVYGLMKTGLRRGPL